MRAMANYETRTRRFGRAEYEKLIDLGVFQPGEAIELIGGELMGAEPQGAAHVYREPAPDSAAPFGWRSARSEVFDASARVTPLAAPGASIPRSHLLP